MELSLSSQTSGSQKTASTYIPTTQYLLQVSPSKQLHLKQRPILKVKQGKLSEVLAKYKVTTKKICNFKIYFFLIVIHFKILNALKNSPPATEILNRIEAIAITGSSSLTSLVLIHRIIIVLNAMLFDSEISPFQ